MAKGSVSKKGKKWYFRFYIEDESGNRIQKEMPGTESKYETESLLRKAIDKPLKNAYLQKPFTDPDFCVLKFVPKSGRFYSWYKPDDFEI